MLRQYGLYEMGRLLGIYSTEKLAWIAADMEFAVIHGKSGHMELASGYKIEVMK